MEWAGFLCVRAVYGINIKIHNNKKSKKNVAPVIIGVCLRSAIVLFIVAFNCSHFMCFYQ